MPAAHDSLKTRLLLTFNANRFAWIMAIVFICFGVMEIINGRFWLSDLEVDYRAAANLLNGQAVYGRTGGAGSGLFKYSPFTLLCIAPYALMPFGAVKIIHFCFVGAMIICSMIYMERFISETFFGNQKSAGTKILFLSVLVAGIHLNRELHIGNWNVHLLFLAVFALHLITGKKEWAGGAVLAWVVLMKPHFVILIPLLLMRKKGKALAGFFVGIFAGLILPSLFLGIRRNIEFHAAWVNTMLTHNTSFFRDEGCIYSLGYKFGLKYLFPEAGILYASAMVACVAFLVFILVTNDLRREHSRQGTQDETKSNFVFEYFLLLAILPSITVTDTEHYLWSLPIIIFIMTYWVYGAKKRNWLFFATIVSFLLYGGNIYDLLGRDLSRYLEEAGIYGMGNILIILSSLVIFNRRRIS
ncbi:MAG: DUF2029 domain-containing protein [Deltaproteobacteria bacterium]|nr:DUF2029 domain-containing protein [Deltaproteobacteria bacterium]